MENKAAEINAELAKLRSAPHNGKMYQADDVEYLLALAETQGRGLGAINPQWFRDQAKLVKGTLDELEKYRQWERNRAESEASLNAQVPCAHPVQLKTGWEDGKVHCWECEWMKLDAENARLREQLEALS